MSLGNRVALRVGSMPPMDMIRAVGTTTIALLDNSDELAAVTALNRLGAGQ